ncbi:glycosyltransferase family 2 protein [Devosia nitrariae]|uniref:Glycosyltransferase 2-like domain-containing protein n=1 Tax=Devosia nitrariae TaxID=2071872 RepID=A0ABQ5W1I1_9HYPH|nr:glycosyltransferase family A protein [Devosia nitrariae]GLQ53666.1 hypothetical protein GCM10010862_09250 [Devosia nitrariae]
MKAETWHEARQDNILVSIVIPAHNADRFLERTLRAAVAQTHAALEIIIVDDGSTDSTREIALRAAEADARIKVVSTANGGVARARNTGIEHSSADYVAFLDADDLWHPTKIALQLAMLEAADPSWAACYSLFRQIDADDFIIRLGSSRYRGGYIFSRHLFAKFVGNGSNLLVRKEAALAVGGFDPSYADAGIGGSEDLDFELKLAARYHIAAVPQFLVGYRCYPGNMSSNQVRMSRAIVETVRRCLSANPGLPETAVRYAWAATHDQAGGLSLWHEGHVGLLLRHKMTAIANDPVLAVFGALGLLRRILRPIKAALVREAPAHTRPYLEISPLEGLAQRPSRYHELRLRQLARIDAEREEAMFHRETPGDGVSEPAKRFLLSEP